MGREADGSKRFRVGQPMSDNSDRCRDTKRAAGYDGGDGGGENEMKGVMDRD